MAIFRLINLLIDRPYYKFTLGACGKSFRLGPASHINNPSNIYIGNDFFSGPNCYMSTSNVSGIRIGDFVMLGPGVKLLGGNHNIDVEGLPMTKNPHRPERDAGIIIEDDVWIGANAVILDGSVLSRGTVIAAGAIVNCKTEPFGIYGGVPARLIKYRT